MTSTTTVEFMLRLVREKHERLKTATTKLLKAVAGEDAAEKKNAANETVQAVKELRAILASEDVPHWNHSLHQICNAYLENQCGSYELLTSLIPIKAAIESHSWSFQEPFQSGIDFDSIFEHYRRESRLPELFDEIVTILENIQMSGAIDSQAMLETLKKLIATIKKGKDGSFSSFNGAWYFLRSFLKNYAWEELNGLPVVGTAFKALQKAFDETNEEMIKVRKQIGSEAKVKVTNEIARIRNVTPFPSVSYVGNKALDYPDMTDKVNDTTV